MGGQKKKVGQLTQGRMGTEVHLGRGKVQPGPRRSFLEKVTCINNHSLGDCYERLGGTCHPRMVKTEKE